MIDAEERPWLTANAWRPDILGSKFAGLRILGHGTHESQTGCNAFALRTCLTFGGTDSTTGVPGSGVLPATAA